MAIKKSSNIGFKNRSIMYVPPAGGTTQTRVGIEATGGTIEDFVIGGITYRSHTFTSSGSFVISSFYAANTDAELVVAAGGQGGSNNNGGGGGGVVYYGSETDAKRTNDGTSLNNLAVGTYTVTVGAGVSSSTGLTGGTSSFVGTNYNISATGASYYTLYAYNAYNSGNAFNSGFSNFQGRGVSGGGGGGAYPENGSARETYMSSSGGSGCIFKYIKPGGLFVGGGGPGGFSSGEYGESYTRALRAPASGSGGMLGKSALSNSAGGGGGGFSGSGYSYTTNGGSGIVVIKYRIY